MFAAGVTGCGGVDLVPAGDAGAPGDAQVDANAVDGAGPALLGACAATAAVASGTLCALQPSVIDPATLDVAGTASSADQAIGYGYHLVGLPTHPDPTKPLWIHFGGTYGRPYDQATGGMASELWLGELMAHGYTVVQVAYANRWSVNDRCQAPNPGVDRDDCAGQIRDEVLTGIDRTPYQDTDVANSVDHRLAVLLAFVAANGVALPPGVDPASLDWSQVRVSGHSQGGNLAYFNARRRGVTFACMLASPYDVPDSVAPGPRPIADWFTAGTSLTPGAQLGQLITTEDPSATAFRAAGSLIGVPAGQAIEVSRPPYHNPVGAEIDGHAAPLADPSLAADRAQACLR
ncbi:MAG: hypothetical protein R3B06_12250 [Kofleriaceae bacterium]